MRDSKIKIRLEKKNTLTKPSSSLPTKEEMRQIIQSLKNNKALGEDSTKVAELLKHASDKATEKLSEIIMTFERLRKVQVGVHHT